MALFGVVANTAYGVTTRATSGTGYNLADHVSRQAWFGDRFGSDGLDEVVASVALPREAPAGEIRILGDCRAMYYSTGEHGHTTRPWLQVATRPCPSASRDAVTQATPPCPWPSSWACTGPS